MQQTLSLAALLRDNPDMSERIIKRIKEVQQDKSNLLSRADVVAKENAQEIQEGTRRKQLLLQEGQRLGKTEEEVMRDYGRFLPTVQTPILNLLYFILREDEKKDWLKVHKQINESFGSKNKDLSTVDSAEELDRICEQLVHEDEKYLNVDEPEDMDRFIYGNMSHSMFVRIKKLKALSTSENQNEAFLAFTMCNKLCKKYGLDFNKVPCYVEK